MHSRHLKLSGLSQILFCFLWHLAFTFWFPPPFSSSLDDCPELRCLSDLIFNFDVSCVSLSILSPVILSSFSITGLYVNLTSYMLSRLSVNASESLFVVHLN